MKAGCAIKPETSVDELIKLFHTQMADVALVMTVEPGFGGQKFMLPMMEKVQPFLFIIIVAIYSFYWQINSIEIIKLFIYILKNFACRFVNSGKIVI